MDEKLLALANMESEDKELIPDILPVDTRLSVQGSASALAEVLSSAAAVAPAKEVIPGTGFVQLEAEDGDSPVLRFSATDGFKSVVKVMDNIVVHLSGSALLPGKRLLDILKLSGDNVRLDVFHTHAVVRSGRAVWNIQLPTSQNLPPLPDVDDIELHPVGRVYFGVALVNAQRAIAKSSARLALRQILVSKGHLIGCDAARLHKLPTGLPKSFSTTLPAGFVETLITELRASKDETFYLGSNKSTVVAKIGNDYITGQRLTSEYPNVEHLMLEPAMLNNETLSVPVFELTQAVTRVRVSADPDLAGVTLAVRQIKGNWTLLVSATDKTGNASQEVIPGIEFTGEKGREETVNFTYLLDFLRCLSATGVVTFRLGTSTKTKVSAIYTESEDFVGVLMPISPSFMA